MARAAVEHGESQRVMNGLSRGEILGTVRAMFRLSSCLVLMLLIAARAGAGEKERTFDFSGVDAGKLPAGFSSRVSGAGKPGAWSIALDEAPTAFPSITGNSPATSKRKVLAQTSHDVTDEHFPLLVFDEGVYDDFTFSAKVKMVGGAIEQMAGLAFRIQDERNYYVVRASALGGTFRFYKFVNGARSDPVGPEIQIPKGAWHEIAVECRGNRIRCLLNGKEAMPVITDTSFIRGKVGFWTKSDSVSYFAEARVSFKPRETLAHILIREAMQKFPRLMDVQIFAATPVDPAVKIIASAVDSEIGQAGSQPERDVIQWGTVYYGKDEKQVTVTIPLRDNNGTPVAAVKVIMKSFPGQTEANAVGRATPVVLLMQSRVPSLKDLLE